MNEELSKKIIEWVQTVGNLASEEVPSFIREVANFGFYEGLFDTFAYLCAFSAALYFVRWCWSKYQLIEKANQGLSYLAKTDSLGYTFGMIFIGIISTLLFFALCCSITQCIKAKVAPKYFVLQRLMKK